MDITFIVVNILFVLAVYCFAFFVGRYWTALDWRESIVGDHRYTRKEKSWMIFWMCIMIFIIICFYVI